MFFASLKVKLPNMTDWHNRNVPKVTSHRKNLPPWVSSSTSHQIKVISTLKHKTEHENRNNLSSLIKLKKKEALLRKSLTQDQADYEKKLKAVQRKKKFLNC